MATVPGTPDRDPIPQELRPTQADLMMAAGMLAQQGRMRVAGDVVGMPSLYDRVKAEAAADPDFAKKAATRETLTRALGGGAKVLPITPKDK